MPDIFISASVSCDTNGGIITGSWSGISLQDATVSITGNSTTYTNSENYLSAGGGSFVFDSLADDTYEVSVTGTEDGISNILFLNVNCGPPPPSCDLEITSVTTTQTNSGLDNGSVTINATGTGTILYSIDGENFYSSNVFTWLPVGVYTAYIQKEGQISCGDSTGFEITKAEILGCMNPDAENYNPAATEDNGSCLYLSRFYACGGVLPNPVNISVSFPVTDSGIAKANHYVKLNIYKTGETIPFATAKQTLRNGAATIDISRYLKNQFANGYTEPGGAVIYRDDAQSFGFHFGIVEYYNGQPQTEILKTQPARVAVNAALPEYTGSIEPYLIKGTTAIPEYGYTDPEA